MCTQLNNLFSCGHRSFKRYDNCQWFGQTCFGAGGNHKDLAVAGVCKDCKVREVLDSQRTTPDGGSPDSTVKDGGGLVEKKDPWWDGDPWRKYRKE